ncbi:hypothetical protein Aspvir_007522 [Aspergillus viridinutans]|uniref:Uncharacterized protein n=1 Tax=Aspergillus viridinutans TaxID=75553 RepID=A0A9P3C162_ASPVI|nr:uncharacterized protein Aspvir_007522 [Aspergillus viridinutans]GIK03451.1 hypothetical protein Aspvir_007522 [Aspergillus viridinutans]
MPVRPLRRDQEEEWRPTSNAEDKSYQLRAPSPSSALDYPAQRLHWHKNLNPTSVHRQTHPRNYTRLLKFLILLYVHQDGWNGVHPFDLAGAGQAPGCHIRLSSPLIRPRVSHVLPALFLETADFNVISMTRSGTVVFANGAGYTWFVIDQTGLETGRMALVEYASNGDIKASTLRRPWNMEQVMSFGQILGRSVSELAQSGIGGHEGYNQPLDMDLPILDILEAARQRGEFLCEGYGSREVWSGIIEQSAPGYLELEARGQEVDFDLASLLPID